MYAGEGYAMTDQDRTNLVTNIVARFDASTHRQIHTDPRQEFGRKWRCPVHSLIRSDDSVRRGRNVIQRWRRKRHRLMAWLQKRRADRREKQFARASDFYRRHEGDSAYEMQRLRNAEHADSRANQNMDLLV